MEKGLYNAAYEHDACGVGMVVNIHGNKSHELVDNALKVLENMRHRGAEGADNKTGDGAGIMLQIPHEFILLQGIPVPEKGKYGTGLVFLPKDEQRQAAILSVMIEEIEREGLSLMHLRTVPTCPECLGEAALQTEPAIRQVFVTGVTDDRVPTFERTLYKIRKRIERRVADSDFYVCSLSSKNIVYKGMLSSMQLRRYFPDLTNSYFTSGLALVHSRFSTNTFPTWSLAQPFRLLAHNGEINTIRGNRGWMQARESVLGSEALGDIQELSPIVQPGMSDSASLDNVLEFFVMSGLSLPHAMALMVPESFNDKNPISEDLKAFYEYHSILMEPWDGPAALLFSDGKFAAQQAAIICPAQLHALPDAQREGLGRQRVDLPADNRLGCQHRRRRHNGFPHFAPLLGSEMSARIVAQMRLCEKVHRKSFRFGVYRRGGMV